MAKHKRMINDFVLNNKPVFYILSFCGFIGGGLGIYIGFTEDDLGVLFSSIAVIFLTIILILFVRKDGK